VKKHKDTFVKVPIWFAVEAAKATSTVRALVWIELLHSSWKARSATVSLPNGRLQRHGVSREVKRRVLQELVAAGLITVERRQGKATLVTLVML
jgi:DNA-binding IscR family transcriptional regulator